jgi:ribonuclease HI
METYYVVKKGHNVGIFKTWAECKKSVDGYKNPVYRKFETYDEAKVFYTGKSSKITDTRDTTNTKIINTSKPIITLDSIMTTTSQSNSNTTSNTNSNTNSNTGQDYISDEEVLKVKQSLNNIKSSNYSDALNYNVRGWTTIENEIYIFTDGSSRKSTVKDEFNSGFGVYLGMSCTNIKEQFTDHKTNNQCELMSLDYAFKLIVRYYRELIEMNKVIKIVSDSEYSIKSISVWLSAWKKNNWKTAKGEDVKNRDLIESIDSSMLRIKLINSKCDATKKIKVKLIHVNSHQPMNRTDRIQFNIWNGNTIADLLACNKI